MRNLLVLLFFLCLPSCSPSEFVWEIVCRDEQGEFYRGRQDTFLTDKEGVTRVTFQDGSVGYMPTAKCQARSVRRTP